MPIAQFSGLASGIDSKSLIDAIIQARELVNDKRRAEIEHLNSENDALEELNTKISALNDLIDPLRTSNGGGLAKKSTSSDPTVATAIIGSNATDVSYGLTVTSVANSATGSFDTTFASTSTAISASSGTAAITVGTGADQVIINAAVTAGVTTPQDLVNAINADSNAAGRVGASLVNVGTSASPSYKIVLTTLQQGTAEGTLVLSGGAVPELAAGNTVEQATDAVLSISGIGSVTRSSNTVDDVISGVTFNLSKAGTTNITIGDDADTTADKVQAIVEAYNDIVKYVADNNNIDQDTSTTDRSVTFGSLAKSRIDEDFLSFFRSDLSTATSSNGTAVTALSEIGISTNRDGTLTFDETAFKTAVGDDPIGVGEVLNDFADSTAGISGSLYQFTKPLGFIDIAELANTNEIKNLNDSIAALERQTEKQRESLTKQFANLEAITGQLQSQQQALSGILAGIG